MTNARSNWLDSMSWQVDFYRRSGGARREDLEFEWKAYEGSPSGRLPETRRFIKQALHRLGLRKQPPISPQWLRDNADALWTTRTMLADDLSRLFFDSALVLRTTNHRRFYFPRIDFEDLLDVLGDEPFVENGFPRDYLGVPLRVFEVRQRARSDLPTFRIITRAIQLHLVNSYRQYLVRRLGVDLSPLPGEVVYDCGACIGEISLLFANMVAPGGEAHLFDPMPLHMRFCGAAGGDESAPCFGSASEYLCHRRAHARSHGGAGRFRQDRAGCRQQRCICLHDDRRLRHEHRRPRGLHQDGYRGC